eukprot:19571-Chlamydomonas_euryale.AAC.6
MVGRMPGQAYRVPHGHMVACIQGQACWVPHGHMIVCMPGRAHWVPHGRMVACVQGRHVGSRMATWCRDRRIGPAWPHGAGTGVLGPHGTQSHALPCMNHAHARKRTCAQVCVPCLLPLPPSLLVVGVQLDALQAKASTHDVAEAGLGTQLQDALARAEAAEAQVRSRACTTTSPPTTPSTIVDPSRHQQHQHQHQHN